MARGLFKKLEQVLYYDYDQPMAKEIQFEIIQKLHGNGYIVISMVSDMYTSNTGFWTQLGAGANKPEGTANNGQPGNSTKKKK